MPFLANDRAARIAVSIIAQSHSEVSLQTRVSDAGLPLLNRADQPSEG